jgi:hypothetical protein
MSYSEAFGILINSLAYWAGPIVAFVSAWLLFLLQEKRKQSFAASSARQSLVAELKWLESHLSMIVVKCAVQSDIVPDGVREFRWFLKEGFQRNTLMELPPGTLEDRDKTLGLPDEKIATLVGFFKHESQAAELPVTITTSILAAPTSAKLSAEEIKKLIDVRWQVSMLATEARNVNEFLRLTFTISDEVNHEIVKINHAGSLRMYGRRANYLLNYVRAALTELNKPGDDR